MGIPGSGALNLRAMARKPMVCDRCGVQDDNTPWTKLHQLGWRAHEAGALEPFVMCGMCEQTMSMLRQAQEAA